MTPAPNPTYHLISLGCPKNLVDSESMAELLNRQGYDPVEYPDSAGFLIVNTCGFLKSAREEAIAVLTDLAGEKKPGQKIIAAGCMTELHRLELLDAVPGIDGLLGTRRWMDILEVIRGIETKRSALPFSHFPDTVNVGRDEKGAHRAAVQGGSAYLKIADGCRRSCAYCLIPLIKGSLVSRPPPQIIEDAKALRDAGMQEIILIAQDITDYGHDLGLKDGLTGLLEGLVKAVPDIPWIRLMYTFPGYINEPLIQLMAAESQVLPYIDLPLQHAAPRVLQAMRRPRDMDQVRQTLSRLQEVVDDVTLRTTFIVGFPNEDEKAFQSLLDFIRDVEFDHLGAFTYSFEPGAPAQSLGDPIPEEVKIERLETLMQVQAGISLAHSQSFIGRTLDVLIEGVDEENQISIGRSFRDAPEIDGLVVVEGLAPVGELVKVHINSAMTHDLVGKIVE